MGYSLWGHAESDMTKQLTLMSQGLEGQGDQGGGGEGQRDKIKVDGVHFIFLVIIILKIFIWLGWVLVVACRVFS